MKYNVLTYLIGEGVSNVFKNKKQAFTAIGTMFITMLIFGVFFVIGENINHFIDELESKQGIQVFMITDPIPTQKDIDQLKEELQNIAYINTIKFISGEEAIQSMKNKMGDDVLEGFSEEKMPASYEITLTDISYSKQVQEEILQLPNVDNITSNDKVRDTLLKLAKGMKIATYTILICLIIFAVFIITNTIRLTVIARRREISIMKYVGATNGFIRWPFAVEGMLIGLISGAIAIGILAIIYSMVFRMEALVKFLQSISLTVLEFSDMLGIIMIVYLILGIGVGVIGSTISMRKYLKV